MRNHGYVEFQLGLLNFFLSRVLLLQRIKIANDVAAPFKALDHRRSHVQIPTSEIPILEVHWHKQSEFSV